MLFGSSKAHLDLRKILVDGHKLEAMISMPSGVFRPYAGVSTGILIFTKTNSGGTDHVWFYDMQSDGFSLDDKRNPVEQNDIPDVVESWLRLRSATGQLSGEEGGTLSGVEGRGFVDYVLWGDDGLPLAVVEAKRTRKDSRIGQTRT